MSTNPATTTMPAAAALPADLTALIASAVTSALTPLTQRLGAIETNQNVIADTLKQLPPAASTAATQAAKSDAGQLLTLDAVGKLFDTRLAAQQQQLQNGQQRDAFISQHLAKLPNVYKGKLGNDPTKWDAEAKAVQAEFEADFKANGGTVTAVGGATRTDGGTPPSQLRSTVDVSKLSPMQKIELGMKQADTATQAK